MEFVPRLTKLVIKLESKSPISSDAIPVPSLCITTNHCGILMSHLSNKSTCLPWHSGVLERTAWHYGVLESTTRSTVELGCPREHSMANRDIKINSVQREYKHGLRCYSAPGLLIQHPDFLTDPCDIVITSTTLA